MYLTMSCTHLQSCVGSILQGMLIVLWVYVLVSYECAGTVGRAFLDPGATGARSNWAQTVCLFESLGLQ